MNYFRQIYYEMCHQKMMTWVSISGTALAIFLIMAIFMGNKMKVVSIAPVSERDRILTGQSIDVLHEKGSSSGTGLNADLAKRLYSNLNGVERMSCVGILYGVVDVGVKEGEVLSFEALAVDDEYWKIYDYNFISGKPFDHEEVESAVKLVVLTESAARKIFGEENVTGRILDIDNSPYTVKGVVKDFFPLLPDGNIKVFMTYDSKAGIEDRYFGKTNVRLLLEKGVDIENIKRQVAKRYEDLNREIGKEGYSLIYHEQPYTSEEMALGNFGSNNSPEIKYIHRLWIFIYGILLLLPAINLSSMTRSRLKHRISEIGVRRAFGAKKHSIIFQIFIENFLMTLVGGIIGLSLSLLFFAFLSDFFFTAGDIFSRLDYSAEDIRKVIWNIFNWSTFFIALGACFVLNLFSATIPAWKATRVSPALAIAKSR